MKSDLVRFTVAYFISVFFISLCSPTRGQFYETYSCFNDTTTFTCIAPVSDLVIWDVFRGSTIIYSVTLHQNTEVGQKFNHSIRSLSISVVATSIISSSIVSTLSAVSPHSTKGFSVACNNINKNLTGSINEEDLLPYSIKVFQLGFIENIGFNFTAVWKPHSESLDLQYTIRISSVLLDEFHMQTVNTSSAGFILRNDSEYDIQISICSNSYYMSVFNFGRCPFVVNSDVILESYVVNVTGVTVAHVRDYSSNQSTIVECGKDGLWDWNTLEPFSNETMTVNTSDEVLNEIIFSSGEKSLDLNRSSSIKPTRISVPVVAGIAMATCLLGVIIGVVASHFKTLYRKIKSATHSEAKKKQTTNNITPIYEDVAPTYTTEVPVSRNIAYEDVHKMTI